MKKIIFIIVILLFSVVSFITSITLYADATEASIEAHKTVIVAPSEEIVQPVADNMTEQVVNTDSKAVSVEKGTNLLWTFFNSSLGVSVVVFLLSIIIGKIFTAKPKWKKLVLKYGPSLMQAIKTAEKKITDDTDNKGLSRLDGALKYLIELEPKLKGVTKGDLRQAITAVHASAEANGNLKKV